MENVKLTELSKGSGCGCKIDASTLDKILANNLFLPDNDKLLVGNSTKDDAAVYDMGNGQALIFTTDFFTPIVNDAEIFGQIAAANAISDVYAMGGKPLMALAILGWPIDNISPHVANMVMQGARTICAKAKIPLAGGHSIDSQTPFFGLAVTGLVNINNLKRNDTAVAGDSIFITKPIGVGILAAAQKKQLLLPADEEFMISQLTQLNAFGEALGSLPYISALTDVTGFGLLGHLIEMAEGANLTATINYANIPIIDAAKEFAKQRVVPDATYRNWNSYSSKVSFLPGVNVMEAFNILPDPQTNGGLLFTAPPGNINQLQQLAIDKGITLYEIGKMLPAQDKRIIVA